MFDALAQPHRREIMRLLAGGEQSVGALASRFDVSQPAVSQHLAVLKAAGLVTDRREGTRRLYSIRHEGLGELHDFLAEVMPAGLERLKRAAEADERRGRGGRAARRN